MNQRLFPLLFLVLGFPFVNFAQIPAVWLTDTTGTLDGVPFVVENYSSGNTPNIVSYDLSTSDYSAFPLSSTQECLDYSGYDDIRFVFDSPVNLYILPKYWRTDTYGFSQEVELLSGSNLTLANVDTISAVSYADGVIHVIQPVTSITITSVNQGCCSSQALNIGTMSGLGVNDIETQKIVLSPNPVTNEFSVSGINSDKINSAYIVDITGLVVLKNMDLSKNVSIKDLRSGVYFLCVQSDNSLETIRFIKK